MQCNARRVTLKLKSKFRLLNELPTDRGVKRRVRVGREENRVQESVLDVQSIEKLYFTNVLYILLAMNGSPTCTVLLVLLARPVPFKHTLDRMLVLLAAGSRGFLAPMHGSEYVFSA